MQFETNIGVVHGTPRRSSKKPMWEIWALAVFQVNNDKSKIMMSHPLLTLDLLSPKLLPWGKESLPTQGTTGDSWKRVLEIGGRIWRRGAEDRTNCLDPQQAQGAHSFVLHLRYPAVDWKIGSGLAGYNSNPSFPASIPTSPRIPSLLSVDSLARLYFSFTLLFSFSVVSDSLWPHGLQHARPPCPSPTPRAYSNSCPSGHWCHPTISSSVIPFSSCLQSVPASDFFPLG